MEITQNPNPLWSPYAPDSLSPITLDVLDYAALKKITEQAEKPSTFPTKNQIITFVICGIAAIILLCLILGNTLPFVVGLPILIVIPFHFFAKKQKVVSEAAYISIALKNQWVYAPAGPTNSYQELLARYPAIFNQGNNGQKVYDQMWGSLQNPTNGTSDYFWMGNFEYTKNIGKESVTNTSGIYAFRLPRPVTTNFALIAKRNALIRASDHTDIQTESTEFNEAFTISYQGDRGLAGPGIFEVLAPDVQALILDLNKSLAPLDLVESVGFYGNAMLVGLFMSLPTARGLSSPSQQSTEASIESRIESLLHILSSVAEKLNA